jgi:hypothetical protein
MPAQPAQPPGMPGGAALDVTVLEWPVPALPGSGPASHPAESGQVEMWVYDGHVLARPGIATASGYREVFTNDPAEAWAEVQAAYLLGGWGRMRELLQSLRDKVTAAESSPRWAYEAKQARLVWAAYVPLVERLSAEIRTALGEVEAATRDLIRRRLARSQASVLKEARRYLQDIPEQVDPPLRIRKGTPLALDRTHVTGLRGELAKIAPLTSQIDRQRRLTAQAAVAQAYVPPQSPGGEPNVSALAAYTAASAELQQLTRKRADLVAAGCKPYPVLARIWRVDPQVDDDDLAAEIRAALTDTSAAAVEVGKTLSADPAVRFPWEQHAGMFTPERIAELADWPPAEDPAGRVGALIRVRTQAGPWAYPVAVAAAAEERGWVRSTMHGAAALEVLTKASSAAAHGFLTTGALMAGQIGLAMIAPPVAVAVDIASAVYDAATSIERYAADETAALAILDPDEAISAPGEARDIAASTLGVLAAAVPGHAGMLVGGLQAAVAYAP